MEKVSKIIISILLITLILSTINLIISKKKISIQENKNKINTSTNINFISMMVEQEDGTYKENKDIYFVSEGYMFNKEKSGCENGGVLNWNNEKNKVEAFLLTSDKCYAYFDIKKIAEDLSGNNYNGTLIGAKYAYDDENIMGIYFDGIDDYVDIVDLPASINWNGGFTIEFEAKWLSFNYFSRIFDFGNIDNSDTIFISNFGTNNKLFLRIYVDNQYYTSSQNNLNQNKIEKIKFIYSKKEKGYQLETYINDSEVVIDNFENYYVENVNRTNNYLGKSNWSADQYFNGYIYNLKITDINGNIILWYKFN